MDTYIAPEIPDDDEVLDPYGPDSGLAALAKFCELNGLPLPPLPAAFIPLLEQADETVFCSRDDLTSLVDFEALIAEVADGEAVPFVGLSHEGFGSNSWALRYCVVLPAAALFVSIPFGGAYMDAETDRGFVQGAFDAAAPLIERALAYKGPQSFIIEHLGVGRARWRALDGEWQDDPLAINTVTDKLAAPSS